MSNRTRALALATAGAASLALLGAGGANAAVLIEGTVTDDAGRGVAGPVSVLAMPDDMDRWGTFPTVASGVADGSGEFRAEVTDPATIQALALEQDGIVDFEILSDVFGAQGVSIVSRRVEGSRDAPVLVDPIGPTQARRSVLDTPPERIALKTTWLEGTSRLATRSQTSKCYGPWGEPDVQSINYWTTVGEINNAYNDGTTVEFTYGRGHSTETEIGIASSAANGGAQISETKVLESSGSIAFKPIKQRLARKLQTKFEYTKTTATKKCGPFETQTKWEVRPTSWIGGTRTEVKQSGTLDRCDKEAPPYYPGDKATMNTARAVRWSSGVNAFGVALTTQTGYSSEASQVWKFGGKKGKVHRICGPDGKRSGMESSRVFSGARK